MLRRLTVALDGDVTILPLRQRMSSSRRSAVVMLSGTRVDGCARTTEGEHECAVDGSCCPSSWCGVLIRRR
jgi:hypothetical protein